MKHVIAVVRRLVESTDLELRELERRLKTGAATAAEAARYATLLKHTWGSIDNLIDYWWKNDYEQLKRRFSDLNVGRERRKPLKGKTHSLMPFFINNNTDGDLAYTHIFNVNIALMYPNKETLAKGDYKHKYSISQTNLRIEPRHSEIERAAIRRVNRQALIVRAQVTELMHQLDKVSSHDPYLRWRF